MSGHSKWHSIKHKKAAIDAKRGKIFTKLIKEIMVAARMGGGDPSANARLRTAIEIAKSNNMPSTNIMRAVKKGAGELDGAAYEESTYEGYGPGGAAVMVEVLTDNKNRTTADVRHAFSRFGGNLGEGGCVSWMFDKKGLIQIDKTKIDEEKLFDIALEAGAEDINSEDDYYEVVCEPNLFSDVKKALEDSGVEIENAEVSMIPQNTVKLEGKEAKSLLKLIEVLEDNDDVQNVYSNFDIPDEVMQELE